MTEATIWLAIVCVMPIAFLLIDSYHQKRVMKQYADARRERLERRAQQ